MITLSTASKLGQSQPASQTPDDHTLVCFSHLRWNFVFQRPQHLMSRFAADRRVIFWEEPEAALPDCDPAIGVRTCAETGVMGALAGMIGTMAALEAVRALSGWGRPLAGRLAIIDMLERRWREVGVAKDPECPICRG